MIGTALYCICAFQLYTGLGDHVLNDLCKFCLQTTVRIALEQRPNQKLLILHKADCLFQHRSGGIIFLCGLVAGKHFLKFLYQLILNFLPQVICICIMKIKGAPVQICPIGNFLYRDIFKILFVHQFCKGLTQQAFGSANSSVFFLCCHYQCLLYILSFLSLVVLYYT